MWCLLVVNVYKFVVSFVVVFKCFVMKINLCSDIVCYCLSIFYIVCEIFGFEIILVNVEFLMYCVIFVVSFI